GNAAIADELPLLHLGSVHRHEARAEAIEAGEILVARRLVDLPFGAKLGVERQYSDAVRFDPAIAAALAHGRIDKHALVGVREKTALAAPALLSRARLVVDEHRNPRHSPQLFLQGLQVAPMVHGHTLRNGPERILVRLVGDDDHSLYAFGKHLPD